MAALGLEVLALAVYPGLAVTGLVGLLCEAALRGRRARTILRGLRRPAAPVLAAAALSAIAAAQLAAPFNQAPDSDRNLLVALTAGAACAVAGWAAGDGRGGGVLALGLAVMVAAALVPAVLAQDLHPQVLGAAGIVSADPVHLAAAAVYVAGLTTVLWALRDSPLRLWLWLPLAGLFASVFLPRPGDDLQGILQFYGAAAGCAALAAGLTLLRPFESPAT